MLATIITLAIGIISVAGVYSLEQSQDAYQAPASSTEQRTQAANLQTSTSATIKNNQHKTEAEVRINHHHNTSDTTEESNRQIRQTVEQQREQGIQDVDQQIDAGIQTLEQQKQQHPGLLLEPLTEAQQQLLNHKDVAKETINQGLSDLND